MNNRLLNKVAVITGASTGIGAEIAKLYAQEGAKVVINYAKNKQAAEEVATEIRSKQGECIVVQADVSVENDVIALFETVKRQYGRLDILVNNAGIYKMALLENITVEHVQTQFNLNVLGVVICTREAIKYMDKGSVVINMSSVTSQGATPTVSVYGASKAAIDSLTASFAKELGARKIRVNAIRPGVVLTDTYLNSDFGKRKEQAIVETALGRLAETDDITGVALFLASEDAKWITGETILVDGGRRI